MQRSISIILVYRQLFLSRNHNSRLLRGAIQLDGFIRNSNCCADIRYYVLEPLFIDYRLNKKSGFNNKHITYFVHSGGTVP